MTDVRLAMPWWYLVIIILVTVMVTMMFQRRCCRECQLGICKLMYHKYRTHKMDQKPCMKY
jgi:hypothetical protein